MGNEGAAARANTLHAFSTPNPPQQKPGYNDGRDQTVSSLFDIGRKAKPADQTNFGYQRYRPAQIAPKKVGACVKSESSRPDIVQSPSD
jgi:hypothetical protein